MATQTIRQPVAKLIPGIPRKNIERAGEFISAVGEAFVVFIGAPFGNYPEVKRPDGITPTEKAVIDAYRWGMTLR